MNEIKTLINFENKEGLQIKEFDTVKSKVATELLALYPAFKILNKDDLKNAKNCRANLNKISKEINDNKIQWVKDMTDRIQSQTKEICELIKKRAGVFDKEIKEYESSLNGQEVKPKAKYQLIIDFNTKEDLEKFVTKIPKKYLFKVKEK